MHLVLNRFKVVFRNKQMIFWTMMFPIILGSLFKVSLGNVSKISDFKKFDIGIVDGMDEDFSKVVKQLEKEFFNVKTYDSYKGAEKALIDSKVVGVYYKDGDKTSIKLKSVGFKETIMKSVLETFNEQKSIITRIVTKNKNPADINNIVKEINSEIKYIVNENSEKHDQALIYYYTLIAMFAMYGTMIGINSSVDAEANMSKRAARMSCSPVNKYKSLLINLFCGFAVHSLEIIIFLIFTKIVLGINYGNHLGSVILLTMMGALTGHSLGLLLGVSNTKSESAKIGISVGIVMLMSFLAGMMDARIKYLVDSKAPIISKINPVSIITDGLYSLYFFNNLDRYMMNIINLLVISIFLIAISFFFIRRKSYDSI